MSSLRKHLLSCCLDDCVQVFNCGETQLHLKKQYRPFSRIKKKCSITDVQWNHNNLVLISSSSSGFISINRSKTGQGLGIMPKTRSTKDLEPIHCLSLSSGSRYLATGGTDMDVKVWDLKQKTVLKRFTGHAEYLSALKFCHSDKHITSSSDSGEIILHDVFTNQDILNLTCKTGVTDLDYSLFFPSLCCSSEQSGAVTLWDVEKEMVYHQFRRHENICKGVSFSRINHMLLVSVGAGGRLVLYDVKDRKEVQVIYAGHPLQSLAFLEDGRHIACGTTNGLVILYDVNNTHRPLFKQKITKTPKPIHRMRFQIFDRSPTLSASPASSRSSTVHKETVELKKKTGVKPEIVEGKKIPEKVVKEQTESNKENEVNINLVSSDEESSKRGSPDATLESLRKSFQKQEIDKTELSGLQDLEKSINEKDDTIHINSFGVSPEEVENLINSTRPISEKNPIETSRNDETQDIKDFEDFETIDMTEPTSNPSPIKKQPKEEIPQPKKTVPEIQPTIPDFPIVKREVERREVKEMNRNRKDLEGMVDDLHVKFDEFKGSIHNDIQNLHIDVIRQFHLQQQEMNTLIKNLTEKVEKVLRENEKLKEENYVFRNMY